LQAKDDDKKVFARKKWTDTGHQWSPHGTYIATFHRPGIRLWGGEKFEATGRFMHNNVKMVEFSPRETYLVTYSWPDRPGDKTDEDAVVIWDVRTGEKKRSFKNEGGKDRVDPFKWSHDDKYFAKIAEDAIQVCMLLLLFAYTSLGVAHLQLHKFGVIAYLNIAYTIYVLKK
jgi:translation initiation factor 3 subunit B